ncbi:MAG: CoA ester lyase [Haloarculaceae archaeon]
MARRTVLFSPGDQPAKLRQAPDSGADVVVFDLEDAVAPSRKPRARKLVRDVLAELDAACEVCVRVNPVGRDAARDIEVVLDGRLPDSVMLPKATGADDVVTLDRTVREHARPLPILPLVETAQGVLAAEEIAAARPTDAVLFGAEDLAADLGATRSEEGSEVLYARQRVVVAASSADVPAIDTPITDFEDTDRLRRDAARARDLGYDGKMVIHPKQVPVVNDAFTPSFERIEWAERVLSARDAAGDAGVFAVDGEMIDPPLVKQAERIVERANAAGVR